MAADAEALTASFSADEQRLIADLRSKYSTGTHLAAPAPAQLPSAAAPTAAAQPHGCQLCAECHGTGTVVAAYNHRTLERCCTQCVGQGTVRTDDSTHSGTHGSGSSSHGRNSSRSADERLAGWEAELEALKQSLAGVADSTELQLKAALILELERAAARLRKSIPAAKQADQMGTAGDHHAEQHVAIADPAADTSAAAAAAAAAAEQQGPAEAEAEATHTANAVPCS
ncbi:hypothetical protein COHA_003058 [Chlorella ohadii]|uniref:Uncharacterized protein n=1 Tax=Chlorella ohadii TaxID=2649997 RepID=A0AAD5DS92_9CHLO|nr:hypothetical protein COHA_003058 [Chlorella ohadii]